MTTALHPPSRRRKARLQEASLIEGPMLLLQSIRGFKSNRSMLSVFSQQSVAFDRGHPRDLHERWLRDGRSRNVSPEKCSQYSR